MLTPKIFVCRRNTATKLLAAMFSFSLMATSIPMSSARAADDVPTPSPSNVSDSQRAGAQVIGALVPILPMETAGYGFARLFALNLGSSPTALQSTTSLVINGLPAGVTIDRVMPEPTVDTPGWRCEAAVCSWVKADGNGAQIPVGDTIEGIVRIRIPSDSAIAGLVDSEVAEMVQASVKKSTPEDPLQTRLQEIASKLTKLKIGVTFSGDSSATSQETDSYLGVTENSGATRLAIIMSGKSTAAVGETVFWDARLVNIGGSASASTQEVANLLPPSIGLSGIKVAGEKWSCGDVDGVVSDCTYSDALEPGEIGAPLRITAVVNEDAKTNVENKWQIDVKGMPPFIPSDGTFTASPAVAPDLGVQLLVGNQVVVPGRTLSMSLQIATYAGSTTKPVTLKVTGLPGATYASNESSRSDVEQGGNKAPEGTPQKVDYLAEGGANGGLTSTDADGNIISEPTLSECRNISDGVVCEVRRIDVGELASSSLVLNIPESLTAKDNSVVLKAEVMTDNESSNTLANNVAATPLVVQPANRPYPSLLPAKKDDKGVWNAFGGESIKLRAGTPTEFGYLIKNTGSKPFIKGTQLGFRLYAQNSAVVTPMGQWKCTSEEFPAPEFTDEQRLGAATAARSAGVGFDLEKPASQLEEDLIKQIKEQAVVIPIPEESGQVTGLDCVLTLAEDLPVDSYSEPAIFSATVNDNADIEVKLWRAELTLPRLDSSPKVDVSALTTVVKKAVSPIVVSEPVRSGSVGVVRVSMSNKGEAEAPTPTVFMSVPAGLRIRGINSLPKGWACVSLAQGIVGGMTICSASRLAKATQSGVAEFQLQASEERVEASALTAVVLGDSPRIGLSNVSETTVGIKEKLTVSILAPENVNDVSIPVGGGEPGPTRVYMSAQSSSDGLSYTWRQLCVSEDEKACFGLAPRVTWVKSDGQSAEFVTPQVNAPVNLTMQVTASDGGAKAIGTTIIKLLPRPKVEAPPSAAGASLFVRDLRQLTSLPAAITTPSAGSTVCTDVNESQPFRFGDLACAVLGVGANVRVAFVRPNEAVLRQLGQDGTTWQVSSTASWATVSASGDTDPKIRIGLSADGLVDVKRSANITMTLRTSSGTTQTVGTFRVDQFPSKIAVPSATPNVVAAVSTTSTISSSTTTASSTTTQSTTSTEISQSTSSTRPATINRDAASPFSFVGSPLLSDSFATPSSGGGGPAPRLTVTRRLGSLTVRGNVLGPNALSGSLGDTLRVLAAASGGSGYSWSWSVISGPAVLMNNPSFVNTINSTVGPSLSFTLPDSGDNSDPEDAEPSTTVVMPSTSTTTPGDVAGAGVRPRAGVTTTTQSPPESTTTSVETSITLDSTTTTAPEVTINEPTGGGPAVLVLKVTAESGRNSASDFLTIMVEGLTDVSNEPKISVDGVSAFVPVFVAPNGSFTVGAGVRGNLSIRWSTVGDRLQLSNQSVDGVTIEASDDVGTDLVLAEALDDSGQVVDVVSFAVVTAHPSAFTAFCDELDSSVNSAVGAAGLDISQELANATDCEFDQSVSFEGKRMSFSSLELTDVAGQVTREGISISSGNVVSQVRIPVTDLRATNLFIPFKFDGVAGSLSGYATGRIEESVASALQLTDWNVSAAVRVAGGRLTNVSLAGQKSSPSLTQQFNSTETSESMASVESTVAETTLAKKAEDDSVIELNDSFFAASGTLGLDGDVLLEVQVKNLELFDLLDVDGSGTINVPASGETVVEVQASLARPVTIIDGVEITEASLKVGNESVEGTGEVSIARGGLSFGVNAALKLSPDEQVIDFSSNLDSVEPVSQFVLTNLEVSGQLSHNNEGWSGSLKAEAADISFAAGYVRVTKPSIELNVNCAADTGNIPSTDTSEPAITSTTYTETAETNLPGIEPTIATESETSETVDSDSSGCEVKLGLMAGLEVATDTPTIGALSASIDTSTNSVEFVGSIENLDLGGGVVIKRVNVTLRYDDGSVSFTGDGEMTVLDAKARASLLLSDSEFVVKVGLENLNPFGETGLRLEAGEIVAVISVGDTNSYEWSPETEGLATIVGAQTLDEGDIRFVAIVDMPDVFENVRSLTGDRFTIPQKVIVKGSYSFVSGEIALDVETADGSLNVSGSLRRESSTAPWGFNFNVEVPEPINVVNGFTLSSISLRVTNLGDDGDVGSLRLTGGGEFEISLSSVSATASAEISFDGPREWSVDVRGAVPTFGVIPGLNLNDLEFSGSLSKSEDSFSGALTLSAANINLGGDVVTLVDPSFEVTVECGSEPDESSSTTTTPLDSTSSASTSTFVQQDVPLIAGTGQFVDPASRGCRLVAGAKMGIKIAVGGNQYFGELTGDLNTAEQTANLTAKLGNVDFGSNVSLTEVTFELTVADGELSTTLDGALRVFGTTIRGRVEISADTAVLQASIADLSPFGDGGPTVSAGEIVYVVSAPADGWAWVPLEERIEPITADVIVPARGIKLAAIVGMPSSFASVERITRGVVALPTQINISGGFNFGDGAVDLSASASTSNYDISGSLARADSDADWAWNVDFRTQSSINLIPGFNRLSLTQVTFNITNRAADGTIGDINVKASGGLRIAVSDSTSLNLAAEVRFSGTDDWELTVTGSLAGANGGSWQIIPGLTLPATNATGSISKVSGVFSAALRIQQTSDWRPINSVTIRDFFIEVGVQNKASTGWQFRFLLGGKLSVELGSLTIPELDITGGYEDGVWFLQVAVGNEVCRDVVVNASASSTTTSTPTSSTASAGGTATSSTTTTLTVQPDASTSSTQPSAAGQSLYRLSPNNSPPRTGGDSSTTSTTASSVATASTSSVPAESTSSTSASETQRLCERVITVADGLEIINGTFRLQYDTNERELSVAVNGGLRILGFQIDASAKLSNKGIFMVAGVKNWELFSGGPVFSELAVVLSTYQTTYTLASGYEASIPGNDVTLIAQMAVPEGITKTVGNVQLEPLKISMRGLLTGNIDLRIGIILPPEAWIFKAGGYGLRLSSVGLQLSIRNFADLTVGVYGEARLLVPDQDNQVPFRIAISFASTGTLSISASMGLDAQGNVLPWQNVFGIDGLTINFAAFSFGINFSSTPIPTPEIGLAISFQLPQAIRDLVGMEDGIDIEGAFFFSTTRGVCLVVQVGREPQVGDTARTLPKAIDMFDHNLIGNYLGIKFAPIGCTIAERTYEPGVTLGFSAAIMGVSFTALAKLDIPKLELQIYANFDEFSIGGLRMKQTYLDLLASGTDPLNSHVIFSGGFDLNMPAGTTRVALRVVARLGSDPTFAIDGRVDSLVVVPGILEINRVRLQGLIKPLDLRLFINLEGNVLLLGAPVTGGFRLDIDDSGVREVSANLSGNFGVGSGAIAMNGMFDFTYLRGGFPNLRFNGSLIVANQEMASAEGQLDQYSFSLKARLNLGETFTGQVEGKIVLCNPDGSIKITNRAGNQVTGAKGDFYFAASANIDLGFATANGNVRLGRTPDEDRIVAETCPVMAPTVTSANADEVMDAAMNDALRCAPGLVQSTTTSPGTTTTVVGGSTTTTAPCPTTTTVVSSTSSEVSTSTTAPPGGSSTVMPVGSSVPTTVRPEMTTNAPSAVGQSLHFREKPQIDSGVDSATCSQAIGSSTACDNMSFGSLSRTTQIATVPNLPRGYDSYIRATRGIAQTISMDNPGPTTAGSIPVGSSAGGVVLSRSSICNAQVSVSSTGIAGNAFTFTDGLSSRASCLTWSGASMRDGVTSNLAVRYLPWTMETWVKPTLRNVDQPIFGSVGTTGVNLVLTPNGRLVMRRGGRIATSSTGLVSNGVWNHVAVAYRPALVNTSVGEYEYYINGNLAGTSPGLPGTLSLTADPTSIIGYSTVTATAFNGIIDQPTWYNRNLTAAEVRAHFEVVKRLVDGTIVERETLTLTGKPSWVDVRTASGIEACNQRGDVSCISVLPNVDGLIGVDQATRFSVTRLSTRLLNDAVLNANGVFTSVVSTDIPIQVAQAGQAALPPNSLRCVGSGSLQNLTGFSVGQVACSGLAAPTGAFSADIELGSTAAAAVTRALLAGTAVLVQLDGFEGTTSLRRQGTNRVFAQINVPAQLSTLTQSRGVLSVRVDNEVVARIAIGRSLEVPTGAVQNGMLAALASPIGTNASVWCPQPDGAAFGTTGSSGGCRTIVFRSGSNTLSMDIMEEALLLAGNRASTSGSLEIIGKPSWLNVAFFGTSHAGLPNKIQLTPAILAPDETVRRATIRLVFRIGVATLDLGAMTVVQVPATNPTGDPVTCRRSESGSIVGEDGLALNCAPFVLGTGGRIDLGRLSTKSLTNLSTALSDGTASVEIRTPSWIRATTYDPGNFGGDRSLAIVVDPNLTSVSRRGSITISAVRANGESIDVADIEVAQSTAASQSLSPVCVRRLTAGAATLTMDSSPCGTVVSPTPNAGSVFVKLSSAVRNQLINAAANGSRVIIKSSDTWASPTSQDGEMVGVPQGLFVNLSAMGTNTSDRRATIIVELRDSTGTTTQVTSFVVIQQRVLAASAQTNVTNCRSSDCGEIMFSPADGMAVLSLTPALVSSARAALANGGSIDVRTDGSWYSAVEQYSANGEIQNVAVSVTSFTKTSESAVDRRGQVVLVHRAPDANGTQTTVGSLRISQTYSTPAPYGTNLTTCIQNAVEGTQGNLDSRCMQRLYPAEGAEEVVTLRAGTTAKRVRSSEPWVTSTLPNGVSVSGAPTTAIIRVATLPANAPSRTAVVVVEAQVNGAWQVDGRLTIVQQAPKPQVTKEPNCETPAATTSATLIEGCEDLQLSQFAGSGTVLALDPQTRTRLRTSLAAGDSMVLSSSADWATLEAYDWYIDGGVAVPGSVVVRFAPLLAGASALRRTEIRIGDTVGSLTVENLPRRASGATYMPLACETSSGPIADTNGDFSLGQVSDSGDMAACSGVIVPQAGGLKIMNFKVPLTTIPGSTADVMTGTQTTVRANSTCTPSQMMSGDYTVLTFTNSAACTWAPPVGVLRIDALAVGGGGGGGFDAGGGGSGGQVTAVNGMSVASSTAMTFVAGVGGAGGTAVVGKGTNGSASSITGGTQPVRGLGGRGGDSCNWNGSNCQGRNLGAIGQPSSIEGSGTGGDGFCATSTGANCVGGSVAKVGGRGYSSSLTGAPLTYGSGGAGGNFVGSNSASAYGGGGSGGSSSAPGSNGVAGAIIVRYRTTSMGAPRFYYTSSSDRWLRGQLLFGATSTAPGDTGNGAVSLALTVERLSNAARPRVGTVTVRESLTNAIVRTITVRQDRTVTPTSGSPTTTTDGSFNTFPSTFTTDNSNIVFDSSSSGVLTEVKALSPGAAPLASTDALRIMKSDASGGSWVSAMLWDGILGPGGSINKAYVHVDELPGSLTERSTQLEVQRLRTLPASLTGTCAPQRSQSGVYTVLFFSATTPCTWAPPSGVVNVDMALVGGGGGGGFDSGAGGTGGQVNRYNSVVMPTNALATVTVGAGGLAGVSAQRKGASGAASSVTFNGQAFQASGGNAGDGCNWNGSNCQGRNAAVASVSGNIPGNGEGGAGYCATSTGANCVGANSATSGGSGTSVDLAGATLTVAAGGAGGNFANAVQSTAVGSGGRGGNSNAAGNPGQPGLVIIRYRTSESSAWQPVATMTVTQRRSESTSPYVLPASNGRKVECTEAGGYWIIEGVGYCRSVAIGYRVPEVGVQMMAPTSFFTSTIRNEASHASYPMNLGFLSGPRDTWSAQVAPGVWNSYQTVRGVYEVSPYKMIRDPWNMDVIDSNNLWDGQTRSFAVHYRGTPRTSTTARWYDDQVGTLTVKQLGRDLPEYVSTPMPAMKGDPGPNGIDCVAGNSPMLYDDGSGDRTRGCRLLEVGSDVTSVGLGMNQAAIDRAIQDTDDGTPAATRCIWKIETSAEVDNPRVQITTRDLRSNGAYRAGVGSVGALIPGENRCGARGGIESGAQTVVLPDVAPNEILVTRVVVKYRSLQAYLPDPDNPRPIVDSNGGWTQMTWDSSDKFEEYLGDYYIVKYGANAIAAEESTYARLLAESNGASPYELPLPVAPSQVVTASQAAAAQNASYAAYQAALGMAPRTTWGDIAVNASVNLGPLQGSFNLAGSFDTSGRIDLNLTGTLAVAPLANATVTGSFNRKPDGQYKASLRFDANVAGVAQVQFSGTIQNGNYDFKGSGAFNLGSVVQADGRFRLSNMNGSEGLVAQVNFFAGQQGVASVRGRGQAVFSSSWWDAEFEGRLFTPVTSVTVGLKLGNLRFRTSSCNGDNYTGNTIVIAGQTFCTLGSVQLDASANLTVFRQNFALNLIINGDRFSATAVAPFNYVQGAASNGQTDRLNSLGRWTIFWLPFRTVTVSVWWGGALTVQSADPAVAFAGSARVSVDWYFSVVCFADIAGQFRPTRLGASLGCSGIPRRIGFNIG